MKNIIFQKYQGFSIGSSRDFNEEELKSLVESTTLPPMKQSGPLAGRGFVSHAVIPNIGPVIVKRYTHGGVSGHLNKSLYLRGGRRYRPQSEFELLTKVRDLGVNVPEPIAFIVKGCFLYKAWFVTSEVEDKKTLAQLSLEDESRARDVMPLIGQQISLLIQNRICHVDLHPGNVLISPDGKPFIIDFDKAYLYKGALNSLRDHYLCRWRRAVIKHELPAYLAELICVELLKNYEKTK